MRAVGSQTLKVDSAATIVTAAAGTVRYDWAALDVDTAGFYVAWWRVTLPGGTLQDTPEFLVEVRAHVPGTNTYVSMAELKTSLAITEQFADADVTLAVSAASRAVDQFCSRTFYVGTPGEVRKYTPQDAGYVVLDDFTAVTAVSDNGNTLALTQSYNLQPANAAAIGRPYTGIGSSYSYFFQMGFPDSFVVTGTFGWPAVPDQVKSATSILAARLLRRSREATFGVIGIGFDGAAVRIGSSDPDIAMMLERLVRSNVV